MSEFYATPFTQSVAETEDGSPTIFVPELNEHYHSIHGAVQESTHVFIRAGLESLPLSLPEIHIFEAGFGTGLNALLTLLYAEEHKKQINYTAIELYPLPEEISLSLNYTGQIREPNTQVYFQLLHQSKWNETVRLTEYFTMEKMHTPLQEADFDYKFDLIYFDAFAPEKQPELWSPEIFRAMYTAMKPGGILTTYCAKGQVRRNMTAAGFQTERLPGPPGKRQMLRARKIPIFAPGQ